MERAGEEGATNRIRDGTVGNGLTLHHVGGKGGGGGEGMTGYIGCQGPKEVSQIDLVAVLRGWGWARLTRSCVRPADEGESDSGGQERGREKGVHSE